MSRNGASNSATSWSMTRIVRNDWGCSVTISPARRPLDVRQGPFGVPRTAFEVSLTVIGEGQNAFGAVWNAIVVTRNAFEVVWNAFGVSQNAFGAVQCSINVTRNAFEFAHDAIVVALRAFVEAFEAVWHAFCAARAAFGVPDHGME